MPKLQLSVETQRLYIVDIFKKYHHFATPVSTQVSLAVCVLTLTAGVAALSVGFSTPRKIESFGEGDLFFVDAQAARFNRGLRVSAAAGIGLCCLGAAVALVGVAVRILQRTTLKERLFQRVGGAEGRGRSGETWLAEGGVVTKAPVVEEGKIPVTLSRVESVQPSSLKKEEKNSNHKLHTNEQQ